MRVIAIDWSGARDQTTRRRHIWIADTGDSSIGLWSGETREHVFAWLIAEAKRSTEPRTTDEIECIEGRIWQPAIPRVNVP